MVLVLIAVVLCDSNIAAQQYWPPSPHVDNMMEGWMKLFFIVHSENGKCENVGGLCGSKTAEHLLSLSLLWLPGACGNTVILLLQGILIGKAKKN